MDHIIQAETAIRFFEKRIKGGEFFKGTDNDDCIDNYMKSLARDIKYYVIKRGYFSGMNLIERIEIESEIFVSVMNYVRSL